jgi:hypothetical protein
MPILVTLLLLLGTCVRAQSDVRVYAGYVYSQEAKEPVVGAQLRIPATDQATTTDIDGYFQLALDEIANVSVIVQAFGFTTDTLRLLPTALNRIYLQSYTMDAVEVKSTALVAARTPGTIQPTLSELRNLPLLLGEPDILKSLTLYPGISGGIEGTTGLHVRGGSPD